MNHAALNVALYSSRGGYWTMTERGRRHVSRDRATLAIGPSALRWTGTHLEISIDEWTAPFPRRVKGTIRIHPKVVTRKHFLLDGDGRHAWWPIAPRARVEVDLTSPGLSWSGPGYLDMNAGDEPLERGFTRWDWSRADVGDGAAVLYDVMRRDGSPLTLGLHFDHTGGVSEFAPPGRVRLPSTPIWRIPRHTRAEGGHATVVRTLEDSPFYARSVVATRLIGTDTAAMHESLDLGRFAQAWVKALLPFRMPRKP
ncbi:MAG: carotenoid 1,2-hydratase [Hyphomicrobiaceae bacterium]|nr:carotenoid 1,2-hydratase [Hyphomicrobiaceae bacterium]